MRRRLDEAMREGAFGLSSALIYPPGSYASTEEIVALARTAAIHGGRYVTHVRGEGDRIESAIDEAVRVGREADIAVVIYHLKVATRSRWKTMPAIVARIAQARADGLDVSATAYPYPVAGTSLRASLPDWVQDGGETCDDPPPRRPRPACADQAGHRAGPRRVGEPAAERRLRGRDHRRRERGGRHIGHRVDPCRDCAPPAAARVGHVLRSAHRPRRPCRRAVCADARRRCAGGPATALGHDRHGFLGPAGRGPACGRASAPAWIRFLSACAGPVRARRATRAASGDDQADDQRGSGSDGHSRARPGAARLACGSGRLRSGAHSRHGDVRPATAVP